MTDIYLVNTLVTYFISAGYCGNGYAIKTLQYVIDHFLDGHDPEKIADNGQGRGVRKKKRP